MDDYQFIQTRIAQQYINQYNATYHNWIPIKKKT
jgi:hypothetical protein